MTSQPRPSTSSSTAGLSYAASLKAVQNRLADPAFSTNPLRILALPRTNTSGSADNISLAAFFKSSPVQLSNASIPEIANVLEKVRCAGYPSIHSISMLLTYTSLHRQTNYYHRYTHPCSKRSRRYSSPRLRNSTSCLKALKW